VPGDVPDALFNRIIVDGAPVTYDLLVNDLGGRDSGVIIEVTIPPTHGTLQHHGDGTVTYTPLVGFVGQDVFAYRLTGPDGTSNQSMVEVLVVSPMSQTYYFPLVFVLGHTP
jgi:hypothetical protein